MSINEHIEQYGLSVTIIEATDCLPSFAYSVGLWQEHHHPEVICFGLPANSLHDLINYIGQLVREGCRFEAGALTDEVLETGSVVFIEVDERNIKDYFGYAMEFYQYQRFPALQMVWPDRSGKFPWEEGVDDSFKIAQPLLDRNADFKFRESPKLGIFTTRQFLDEGKPILRVLHETDGDWQFLTGDQYPDDIRLVALSQVVKNDPTLNGVFNLDYGESAEREFVGGTWVRTREESEE